MNNQARLHDIITNTGIDDIYIRSEPTRDRGNLQCLVSSEYSMFRYHEPLCCDRFWLAGGCQLSSPLACSNRLHQLSHGRNKAFPGTIFSDSIPSSWNPPAKRRRGESNQHKTKPPRKASPKQEKNVERSRMTHLLVLFIGRLNLLNEIVYVVGNKSCWYAPLWQKDQEFWRDWYRGDFRGSSQ